MVKRVEKVLEKAENSPEGVGLGAKNHPEKNFLRPSNAERVYKAEVDGDDITLFHYDTPIVTIHHFGDPVLKHRDATIHDGAYSSSDQRAINTALRKYRISKRARRSEGEIWLED